MRHSESRRRPKIWRVWATVIETEDEQAHPQGISASKMGDMRRDVQISHSIFDFQAPDADLRNGDLRSALFEVLRRYHARGPVLSTELDDGKSCLFIFAGKDGGYEDFFINCFIELLLGVPDTYDVK